MAHLSMVETGLVMERRSCQLRAGVWGVIEETTRRRDRREGRDSVGSRRNMEAKGHGSHQCHGGNVREGQNKHEEAFASNNA